MAGREGQGRETGGRHANLNQRRINTGGSCADINGYGSNGRRLCGAIVTGREIRQVNTRPRQGDYTLADGESAAKSRQRGGRPIRDGNISICIIENNRAARTANGQLGRTVIVNEICNRCRPNVEEPSACHRY